MTQQQINPSQNLAIASNPGMAAYEPVNDDSWTTEKFIQFNNGMAQAYLPE